MRLSGTNSPDALWRGYNAISSLFDLNALNLVVFFADGASTNFSATLMPSAGACDPGVHRFFPMTRGISSASRPASVAAMARADLTTPVTIFFIGMGANAPPPETPLDVDLLNRVSNTPASPSHDSNQPIGKTFITLDSPRLQDAFD